MGGLRLTSLDALAEQRERLPAAIGLFADVVDGARERIDRAVRVARDRKDRAERAHDRAREDLTEVDEDADVTALEDVVDRAADTRDRAERACDAAESLAAEILPEINHLETRFSAELATALRELDDRIVAFRAYLAVVPSAQTSAAPRPREPAPTPEAATLPPLPYGLSWVPLASLDWSEIPADLAFAKMPRDRMAAMMTAFQDRVAPLLAAGKPIDRAHLLQMDRSAGIDTVADPANSRSLALAADCLLGSGMLSDDLIAVTPPAAAGGPYGWTSGRHRALLARELGWTHVPARVLGPRAKPA